MKYKLVTIILMWVLFILIEIMARGHTPTGYSWYQMWNDDSFNLVLFAYSIIHGGISGIILWSAINQLIKKKKSKG
jgi:hypothetical protein